MIFAQIYLYFRSFLYNRLQTQYSRGDGDIRGKDIVGSGAKGIVQEDLDGQGWHGLKNVEVLE